MNHRFPSLSVTAPLSPALERVKVVLFRPFALPRWLAIGFCAWLAFLGQGGGGGGGHYNFGNRHQSLRHGLNAAWDYVVENLAWILPLVAGLFLLGVILWILFTWLSSRGQFMFLHCVATNRAEVAAPWRAYGAEATSLWLFRLVLGFVSFLVVGPAVVGAIALVLTMVAREAFSWLLLAGAVGAFLAAAGCGIVFAVIRKLTLDFVVPVMARRRTGCAAAWGEFLRLTTGYRFDLVFYLLFQVVLALVVGMAVLAVTIATCCVAGCLMALPYLGTVFLLPVYVFDRAYSLHYLAQFGPEWELIAAPYPPQTDSL